MPTIKKILLLLNPLIEQRLNVSGAEQVFRNAGVDVHKLRTLPDHATVGEVRQALPNGYDAIIVCGGDGTIFDAVQAVAGTSTPIGLIPFGTGNVVAQNLRIPADALQAANGILNARPRRIALGRITCAAKDDPPQSWYFVFSAGLGMHASLMEASKAWGKRTIGAAAYFAAGTQLLLTGRIVPFEMETTDIHGGVDTRICCEAIAARVPELNRWRPAGEMDAASIRIFSVPGNSRLALARAFYHALLYRSTEFARKGAAHQGEFVRAVFRPLPTYEYFSPVQIQADGEVLGHSTAIIESTDATVIFLEPESV
jgi:diacylglycerol kinase (ATP)